MQTCSIKLNYFRIQTVVSLYKRSSCTNYNWQCIIAFLINAPLLNVYFILHYYLFSRKEIYFFECLYFSECNLRMSLHVFWLKKAPSIKYATVRTNDRWQSDFSVQKLRLFFQSQYLLTLFLGEAVTMKQWKSKTRDYHQTERMSCLTNSGTIEDLGPQ